MDKRKPGRHGGPDGQATSGLRGLRRRWGFRAAGTAPSEAPPAHMAPPSSIAPPPSRGPAPAGPPPGHAPSHPAPVPPAHLAPLAARRHQPTLDTPPRSAPSAPPGPPAPSGSLPHRLPARQSQGQPSTAAGEGSIDDITAMMDFLRRDGAPGAERPERERPTPPPGR